MLQAGDILRLAVKAIFELWVIGQEGVQNLDRYVTIKRGVIAPVDLGHTAPPQALDDLVFA